MTHRPIIEPTRRIPIRLSSFVALIFLCCFPSLLGAKVDYPAAHRFVPNHQFDGSRYDSNGNVTSIQSSATNGTLLTYQYDSLNRLTNVVDGRLSGTQNTRYSFDAVGNLQTIIYPTTEVDPKIRTSW